jgi:hypothetical protein
MPGQDFQADMVWKKSFLIKRTVEQEHIIRSIFEQIGQNRRDFNV